MRLFAFIVLLVFGFSGASYAHRPYLVKKAVLHDENQNAYILETWNGDGIFFADPFYYQIRNSQGDVIARTAASTLWCKSFEKCWSLTLIPKKLFLDLANIEAYNTKNLSKESLKEFSDYLANPKTKYYRGGSLDYPEEAGGRLFGFKTVSFWQFPWFWILMITLMFSEALVFYISFSFAAFCMASFIMYYTKKTWPTQGGLILLRVIIITFGFFTVFILGAITLYLILLFQNISLFLTIILAILTTKFANINAKRKLKIALDK